MATTRKDQTVRGARILGALVSILGLTAAPSAGQGSLDSGFGMGGTGRTVSSFGAPEPGFPEGRAVAIQSDGSIVVVGGALQQDPTLPPDDNLVEVAAIARYDTNGSLSGVTLTPALAFEGADFQAWEASAVVLSDGKIVVAGGGGFGYPFLDDSGAVLARYDLNGSLDRTFARFPLLAFDSVQVYPGNLSDTNNPLRAGMVVVGNFCQQIGGLAVQPDGRIVVGGCGGSLARLNWNGTPDLSFGPVGNGRTFVDGFGGDRPGAFAIQSDGRIVVTGATNAGNFTLARTTPDGQRDVTFGAGAGIVFTELGLRVCDPSLPPGFCEPAGGSRAVMIQSDGKIIAAGTALVDASIPGRNGLGLARYNPDGSLDPGFGIGGKVTTDFGFWAEGRAAALQPDGKIVVVGTGIDNTNGVERFLVARYNADGSLDDSFGVNGRVLTDFAGLVSGQTRNNIATAVSLQTDAKIVVAGSAGEGDLAAPATASYFALARYLGGAGGGNTPAGSPVTVQLNAVNLTFQTVTVAGDTTVTTSLAGPPPPSGLRLGQPPTYFDIDTTAVFSGLVQVCINYQAIAFDNEADLQLMHFDGASFINITTSLDTTNDVICGSAASLSPFAIMEPASTDGDGDGIFDALDNCPSVYNPDQADNEADGIGDACDADDDGDGISDVADNCPVAHNPDQTDSDGDGTGDVCDADDDGDGISDAADQCPNENAMGFDADGDGCIDSFDGLINLVDTLVAEGVISQQMRNSLVSKVQNADASSDSANICAAVNELHALENQIQAQRGKKISPEAADLLRAYANNLIAQLLSALPAGESCG